MGGAVRSIAPQAVVVRRVLRPPQPAAAPEDVRQLLDQMAFRRSGGGVLATKLLQEFGALRRVLPGQHRRGAGETMPRRVQPPGHG